MTVASPNIGRIALDLLAPYSHNTANGRTRYPGRGKLWRDVLGDRITFSTIRVWRSGAKPWPQWARDRLAAALERSALERLEIAKQLRQPRTPGK